MVLVMIQGLWRFDQAAEIVGALDFLPLGHQAIVGDFDVFAVGPEQILLELAGDGGP